MINQVNSLEDFNSIFIQRIINASDSFLPFDDIASDAITNDRIESLRYILQDEENKDYNYYSDLYNLSYSPLDTTSFVSPSPYLDQVISYFYPFSKSSFINAFYPDVFPSLVNQVISYMKQTGRIIHIGKGHGKALIIYPVLFQEQDYSYLLPLSYSNIVSSTVNIANIITQQQADISYLLKTINTLQEELSFLKTQNQNLETMRVNDYLTTWR
jgi:hypothetical protein